MPSRGRERGLLSSPTAAAGGRWVGSEGAGVAFMLRNRGPPKKKGKETEANAFVSALAAREASNDKESQENDAGGKEDDVAHEQERAVC